MVRIPDSIGMQGERSAKDTASHHLTIPGPVRGRNFPAPDFLARLFPNIQSGWSLFAKTASVE